MEDTLLRVPVVCPECGKELMTEFPTASIAEALANGEAIRLHAGCHGKIWHASNVEREQLWEYLEVVRFPLDAAL